MSQAEEEPELRDLVTDALEKSGVLAAVRAHLRAGVFLALEREHEQKCAHHSHLQQLFSSRDGRLALLLVHELLEFCRLRHTASVYSAETGQPNTYVYKGREALLYELQLTDFTEKTHLPILVQLISILFKLSKNTTSTSHATIKNQTENGTDSEAKNETFANSPIDNYDTTFTSDSVTDSVQEDKSKTTSQIDYNISEEIEKSSSEHVEDDKSSIISERSFNTDAQIELHTDSDKSLPDVSSNSDSKRPTAPQPPVRSNINSNEKSTNSKEAFDDIDMLHSSDSSDILSKLSNLNSKVSVKTNDLSIRNAQNSKNDSEIHHMPDDSTSQYSNKTDTSERSITEEIAHSDGADNSKSKTAHSRSDSFDKSLEITEKSDGVSSKSINNVTKKPQKKSKLHSSLINHNMEQQLQNNGNNLLKRSVDLTLNSHDKISKNRLPSYSAKVNLDKDFVNQKPEDSNSVNGVD